MARDTSSGLRPPWLSELAGGAIGAVVMLAVVLTLGLLGVAPLGEAAAPRGLAAAFVAATVGGLVFGLLGGCALPTAGPSSATALIYAGLLAPLAHDASLGGQIAPLLAAAGATVVLMGLLQLLLAAAGLGRLARYVPQPVLAGFMNGVALLIFVAQWPALLGRGAEVPPGPWQPGALALGLGTAALTWLLAWRWPRAPAQLLGLAGGVAAFVLLQWGAPAIGAGPAIGPLPGALPLPDLPLQLAEASTRTFVWAHRLDILTGSLVLALIGSLESALSGLAIDQLLGARNEPDRDLRALGLANVAVGLFAGLPVVVLRARALATLRAGGRGRRAALVGASVFGLLYALSGSLLARLPQAVLAGTMLTVAVALVDRWTRELLRGWRAGTRSEDSLSSLAIVGVVCALTVWKGFVVGVAAGTVVALLLFVRSMNRSLVRSRYSAADEPSRRVWGAAQEELLQRERARIVVVELEGALFFGSAERLARELAGVAAPARSVVLDLRGVRTLDASGALLLGQLAAELPARGLALRLAGVTPDNPLGRSLRALAPAGSLDATAWFADTDHAIEAAERQLLLEAGLGDDAPALPLAASALARGLAPDALELLQRHLQPQVLPAGATLFQEGDTADGLYVLLRGSLSLVAGRREGRHGRRFATLSPGALFGETALLDGGGRSATASADTECELLLLSQAALDALTAQSPALAAALYRNVALHLSERLRRATALRPSARR